LYWVLAWCTATPLSGEATNLAVTTTPPYLLDYPLCVTIGATATLAGVTTERSAVKQKHHKEEPANQE